MIRNRVFSAFLSVMLLFTVINFNTLNVYAAKEMKGVWVASRAHIDYPKKVTADAASLKQDCISILDKCKDLGFNTVFFQVRPASDALYKSSIFPWSADLTGGQGTPPTDGFDPLAFWVSEAHKRNITIHAWINPYRVTVAGNASTLSGLANTNPAKLHPEYCFKYSNGNYYYNPALPEVRQLLIDGVMEIIKNYDVDGIHMDDYFYPGSEVNDIEAYTLYANGQATADWRRDNVNKLIKSLHDSIKGYDSSIIFGISPSGVWANKGNNELGSDTTGMESYSELYADTRKWALEGWIDYIAPQIYWQIGHKAADYKTLAYWWSQTLASSSTKLYIGIGDYRVEDAGTDSPWYNGAEVKSQFNLNDTIGKIDGEIHFSYTNIVNNPILYNIIKSRYNPIMGPVVPASIYEEPTVKEKVTEATTSAPISAPTQSPVREVIKEDTVESVFDVSKIVNTSRTKVLVYIDGKKVEFTNEPIIINGRTMVPLREIFEALGANVTWDGKKQIVGATRGSASVSMTIGSATMNVSGKPSVKLDAAPVIKNSRTFIPLRAVSEAFGLQVGWYDPNRVVTITTK